MTHLQVVERKDSAGTIIAFSARRTPSGKFTFWRLLSQVPMNVVFVNDPSSGWYLDGVPEHPSPDALSAALLDACRGLGDGLPVFTMGSSMGAYAALFYGARVRADRIIAFAPEVCLGLPYGRSVASVKNCRAGDGDIGGLAFKNPARALILSGDNDVVDYYSSCAFRRANPALDVRLLRNAGHNIPHFLSERLDLADFVVRYLTTDDHRLFDESAFSRETDFEAARAVQAFFVACHQKRPAPADLSHVARLAERNPDWGLIRYLEGLRLELQGKEAQARAHYRAAVAAMPNFWRAGAKYAASLIRAGEYAEAEAQLRAHYAKRPSNAALAFALSKLHEKQNCVALAIDALERLDRRELDAAHRVALKERFAKLRAKLDAKFA
jgi:hypothetical protein